MNEQKANSTYDAILKKVVIPHMGNKSTHQDELENICRRALGSSFKGVYPSDKIPPLNDLKKYSIVNLDRSGEAGSHWVALAHSDGNVCLYDSFGRSARKILPKIFQSGNGQTLEADNDAEQDVKEMNCGQRCVAWLIMFDRFGEKPAMLI